MPVDLPRSTALTKCTARMFLRTLFQPDVEPPFVSKELSGADVADVVASDDAGKAPRPRPHQLMLRKSRRPFAELVWRGFVEGKWDFTQL